MTDEELVKRLDNLWTMLEEDGHYVKANTVTLAKERIEALTAERDEQIEWVKRLADMQIASEAKLAECEARLGKAVELLKEARQDLEEYVTYEWPKDEHPVYERKWDRDMELCRRIDATLAEIEGLGVKQTG
jgi:succinate dehydrogenase/fumarate reductase flavoprotein subunit